MDGQQPTRREVLKKAVYAAPVILTLAAVPSFAGTGSSGPGDCGGGGKGKEKHKYKKKGRW